MAHQWVVGETKGLERNRAQREDSGLILEKSSPELDDASTDGIQILHVAITQVCKNLPESLDIPFLLAGLKSAVLHKRSYDFGVCR
jgi:hypothetical protein